MIANAAFVARAAFAIIFPRDQRVKWVSGSRPAGLWIRRCAGGTTTSLELDADEAGALDDRLPASGLEADELIELGHVHGLGDEAVALQPRGHGPPLSAACTAGCERPETIAWLIFSAMSRGSFAGAEIENHVVAMRSGKPSSLSVGRSA